MIGEVVGRSQASQAFVGGNELDLVENVDYTIQADRKEVKTAAAM